MHSLLTRQLQRHGIDVSSVPESFHALLRAVDSAYDAFDEDRLTLERSLDLSSQELLSANTDMRAAGELLRTTLESTADGILAVDRDGRVLYSNERFRQIWRVPPGLLEDSDNHGLLRHLSDQVVDEELLRTTIREFSPSGDEGFATIQFKDGRVVERYSRPFRDHSRIAGRIWSFRDITERVAAEQALRESEQRFRALAQNSSDMILIVNTDGIPQYLSPAAERLMGYGMDDVKGVNLISLLHPDDLESGAASFVSVLRESGQHPPKEVRLRRADGAYRHLEIIANNLIANPAVGGVVFNARDVTERVEAEQTLRDSEERLRRMAETTPVGIYQMSARREVTYLNPAACAMFEVADEDEMNLHRYEDFFPAESLAIMRGEHAKRGEGLSSTYEVELIGNHGTRRDVMISGAPLYNDATAIGVIGTIVDITERKQQERLMRYAATHDALTDAFNRRRFEEEVNLRIQHHRDNQGLSAVLFLDLDDFKAVNDTFGHPVGDRLLTRVTRVLRSELRDSDVLARLGGDEFAALLPDTDAREARLVARRLLRALARHPVEIEGRLIDTLCSIGVAMIPTHGTSSEELLARADLAMYEAKERGRNRVSVYSARGRRGDAADRLTWKHRIREALDGNGLALYGQPIVNLDTGEVDRHELLLRMNGSHGRLLLPGSFLGIAESYGLIAEIDAWVVHEAVRFLKERNDAGSPMRVAVNLSARALDDLSLLRIIKKELTQARIDPGNVCFEITESAAIQDVDKLQRLISGLTDLGCEFALDDFGVGFSSFSRLKHLRIHELKIDGSFIQRLHESEVDQHLVRAIVEMARGLGMRVVAEFVENAESARLLRVFGVDYGQGYYFGRPTGLETLNGPSVARAA